MPLPNIEIVSKRLRGGRMSVSPKTDSRKERNARRASLYVLVRRGRFDVLERLRSRELDIVQVHEAVETGTVDDLRPTVDADISIGSLIDRELAMVDGRGVAGTSKAMRSIANQIKATWPRETLITDITGEQIEAFIFGPKGKAKQPWGSVRQEQARDMGGRLWDTAIRTEAELAERHGMKPRITINPWRGIVVIARRSRTIVRAAFLQREEWLGLEVANDDTPELALCAISCLAGLRIGEVINLRTSIDVDMAERVIRITPRKGAYKWKPKTPRSVRVVPMGERLHAILARHIELGFAGERYFIRTARQDRPMSLWTAECWTRRAFERAGIKYGRNEGDGLTNHNLRHTFASWLAQANEQLKKIAELLGDTVETVDKYYAHLLPGDHRRTVRVIDNILGEA